MGIKLDSEQNYGMTGYYDENTYFTYGIYKNGDGYALKLCLKKIDEDEKYTCTVDITEVTDSLYLKISTEEGLKRTFSYSHDGKTLQRSMLPRTCITFAVRQSARANALLAL